MSRPLSPQQSRFAELYIAGPDDLRGNGTRCYQVAYPTAHSKQAACESASRLLRRPQVRARIAQLREIAAAECTARLRNWMELAPDAQETLRAAAAGELVFDQADPKLRPELLRSAVRSATEILDRALGTTKQMHEHKIQGGIIVAVAGPPQVTQQGDDEPWQDSLGNGSNGYLPPA
jgi:hypothetical protein